MRLLLVNTPIDRHDILGKFTPIYKDMKMVPTGLGYLAAVARNAGMDVQILDQYAECLPMNRVFQRIRDFSPGLIGLSATTPNFFAAIHLARSIKSEFSHVPIVMGGYHPSVLPDQTLDDPAVDFVIRDEGEHALTQLSEALDAKWTNFDHIDGLSFKGRAGYVHNKKAANIAVNSLPFPAYDLLPMHLYSSPSFSKFASPVYQMVASRGCPYRCTFCINAELNVSAKYRKRNIESVVDEMEMLAERYHAKQIQFWDPIFPLGKRHAQEFCQEITARSLHKRLVWNSTTRAEFLDEETIEIMVQAGCRGLGFGLESGVPEILQSVHKNLDLEKTRSTIRIAREKGLVLTGGFILGFPGETKETAQRTIDYAQSLDLHYAQFSIMVPYPGTPLFRSLQDAGEIPRVEDNDFSRYNQSVGLTDLEPIYVPEGWTSAELKNIQKRAYTEFYFRARMVWRHLPHLKLSKIIGMMKSFWALMTLLVRSREGAK
jgi:anaerobic magnesium-protoporphyrin IX monomethyl ester cyclase